MAEEDRLARVLGVLTRRASARFPDDPSMPGVLLSYLAHQRRYYASLQRFRREYGEGKVLVLNCLGDSPLLALTGLAERALLQCFEHDDCLRYAEEDREPRDELPRACFRQHAGQERLRAEDRRSGFRGLSSNHGVLLRRERGPTLEDVARQVLAASPDARLALGVDLAPGPDRSAATVVSGHGRVRTVLRENLSPPEQPPDDDPGAAARATNAAVEEAITAFEDMMARTAEEAFARAVPLLLDANLPDDPRCVSPNGRTDGHGAYVERAADGRLVCAFCKEPLA